MKMKMKMKIAKANKKGFTIVELVIVIAILAILAAIALPTITTMINSAKLSTMESDKETLDILLKTAVTEVECKAVPTTYNGTPVCSTTPVHDILVENKIKDLHFSNDIGNVTYYMVWEDNGLEISTDSDHAIDDSTTLATLLTT